VKSGEILRQGSISSTYAFGFLEEKHLLVNVVWQAKTDLTNVTQIWHNSAQLFGKT